MIKLDIVNAVVNRTGITKTKAEQAVETIFESMKKALERGNRIELRGFGVFNVKPPQNRHRAQSPHGRRGQHPPGQGRSFQTGQGVAESLVLFARARPPPGAKERNTPPGTA